MSVEVKLFATLREGRGKKFYFDYVENMTSQNILDTLNIDKNEVAILLVNGMNKEFDYKIDDKDILAIFPPVGGG